MQEIDQSLDLVSVKGRGKDDYKGYWGFSYEVFGEKLYITEVNSEKLSLKLQDGDLILAINGVDVCKKSKNEINGLFQKARKNKKMELQVQHDRLERRFFKFKINNYHKEDLGIVVSGDDKNEMGVLITKINPILHENNSLRLMQSRLQSLKHAYICSFSGQNLMGVNQTEALKVFRGKRDTIEFWVFFTPRKFSTKKANSQDCCIL